jgi:hypothetical protein
VTEIWVCAACGKTAPEREAFNDASCFLWAVLCVNDLPEGADPRSHHWTAVVETK